MDKKNNKLRQGWRYFNCECGNKWKSKSRDCYSPSGEDCNNCFDFCFPYKSELDLNLKADTSGNLV